MLSLCKKFLLFKNLNVLTISMSGCKKFLIEKIFTASLIAWQEVL